MTRKTLLQAYVPTSNGIYPSCDVPPMMNMYMQRPQIDPILFQQMQMRNMIPPNGRMPMMPMQNHQSDSN